MCTVESGLLGFFRDNEVHAAMTDLEAGCSVAFRVCMYSGNAGVFHDVQKLHGV